jgi:hypothetical protein
VTIATDDEDESTIGAVDEELVGLAREALDQMKGIADYANAESEDLPLQATIRLPR